MKTLKYLIPFAILLFISLAFAHVRSIGGVAVHNYASGSGYIHNSERVYTDAAGYQIITGYQSSGAANMGTLTDSNLAVAVNGTYLLMATYSLKGTKALEVNIHGYTNGVVADNAGTSTYLPNVGKFGSCTLKARLQMYAGDYVDLRIDVDGDDTITFEHAGAFLQYIGPLDQ